LTKFYFEGHTKKIIGLNLVKAEKQNK